MGEARFHYTYEDDGGFFGNFGLERIFTLDSAGADVSLGFWVDYDEDNRSDFGEATTQIGVAGKIKTRRWDLLGNGYFNVGTTDFTAGDPSGANCFFENHIVLQPGIDSSLQGFDATLRLRPQALGMVNGTFDIGGYGYSSDIVEYFGGGRVRLGFQVLRGLLINAEVNYDDRFDVTGLLSAGWVFGVNARGNEYAGLGRDLEETVRNDHIVRFRQDLVLALDPDTGLPYNVFHVDNTSDPAFSLGTAENPFATLAEAEAASGVGDIIFVREGTGTAFNMDQGITLQDDQLFLGDGVQHLLPVQNGQLFELCNDQDGNLPTITGSFNGPAVTLANNNVVRGFNIDGAASASGMGNGIVGNGVNGGTIEDNIIQNANLDGVQLEGVTGDWNIARNTISSNARDGINIFNTTDTTSQYNFTGNIVSANLRDGIHMENYDAAAVQFLANITNDNLRHGVHLEGFVNGSGTGLDLDINTHSSDGNNADGIRLDSGDGDVRIANSSSTNNGLNGLTIIDWTNSIVGDAVSILSENGGVSDFSNNTAGFGISNTLTAGTQNFNINGTSADGNLNGLGVRTVGITASIDSSIVNNTSFSNNVADGMRFFAEDGSSQNVLIENNTGANLAINGNGGAGINIQSGNVSAGTIASIQATIRNINSIANNTGLNISAIDDGEATVAISDSLISASTTDGINMNIGTSNNGALNRLVMDNVTVTGSGDDAIQLTTDVGSKADLVVLNSSLTTGGGSGINLSAAGSAAIAGTDNRTRMIVRGSTITGFTTAGINGVATGDSASVLADVRGNLISGNGAGINLSTTDTALVSFNLIGNTLTGNAAGGANLTTAGTSTINAFWENNGFTGNGTPAASVTNGAGSLVCIALSSNFFDNGFAATNAGAVGDFIVELDGLSNGFGAGSLPANLTVGPFGAVCQPAIATEEAAFAADGFPAVN